MHPLEMSVRQLAAAIAARRLSSLEVVQAHVERIQRVNPLLNAVIHERFTQALEEARAADAAVGRGERIGPLHGVPMTVKDSLDTAGTETTAGTAGGKGRVPATSATAVDRLLKAGAILLGKTNTPELTLAGETENLLFGRTRNPHAQDRTAGGSSGAGAALVAAGGSPFDIGSDTRGSLRWPSHCCGVATLKPTFGRIPRTGHALPPGMGALDRLTHIGPMARKVEDLSLLLDVMSGWDPQDTGSGHAPAPEPGVDMQDLRVGLYTGETDGDTTDDTWRAISACAHALASAGARVDEADLQRPLQRAHHLYHQLVTADGGAWLARLLERVGTPVSQAHPWTSGRITQTPRLDTAAWGAVMEEIDALRSQMLRLTASHDVLITPVVPMPACRIGEWTGHIARGAFRYTEIHNLTGWPCAVLPVGHSSEGVPIGVQIAAAPWRDTLALQVARYLEGRFGGWRPIASPDLSKED